MAMDSPLNTAQTSSVKSLLRQRWAELREEIHRELIASDAEGFAELAGRVHDPGDESVADLLVDLNLAIIDRHVAAIREVEEALQKISRGVYGVCEDCGGNIPYDRLLTEPTAQRCFACQGRHERSHVQPGRPRL